MGHTSEINCDLKETRGLLYKNPKDALIHEFELNYILLYYGVLYRQEYNFVYNGFRDAFNKT